MDTVLKNTVCDPGASDSMINIFYIASGSRTERYGLHLQLGHRARRKGKGGFLVFFLSP